MQGRPGKWHEPYGENWQGLFEKREENLTVFAGVELIFVVRIRGAIAKGSIEKPTEVATLEFPGRTLLAL